MSLRAEKMTMDRAARRFSQIASIERQINITEAEIKDASQHAADARKLVDELREKKSTLMQDLRKAARDEGELPLLSLAEFDE